jgi:electron transfer flavoprotein beta subunit
LITIFVKQVPDNTRLKLGTDGPLLDNASMIMNPYDEYALESALKVKDTQPDKVLATLSLGAGSTREILKKTIALGADQALLVEAAQFNFNATATAQLLTAAMQQAYPQTQLALFGQQALDTVSGLTGPLVGSLLGWPCITHVKQIIQLSETDVLILRQEGTVQETLQITLPAILCFTKCDYELRSANIKGVMKANKTDIPVKTPFDLGIPSPEPTTLNLSAKPMKAPGQLLTINTPQEAVEPVLQALKTLEFL